MTKFFCAEAARQAKEDLIGSGASHDIYVLVECPTPWTSEAFDSPGIPQNLRELVQEVRQAKRSVRFLLIAPRQSNSLPQTTLLIYQQQHQQMMGGYVRSHWIVNSIEQVADIVRGYLAGDRTGEITDSNAIQDILICTHGAHDQCCAKYGLPFYRQAIATLSALNLGSIRVWKTSHFGGHRFAPTAIVLPEGRYYGALNEVSFRTLLTRTGDIQAISPIYRGWGILPAPLQVLERTLMLRYGWEWFNCKIAHIILEHSENQDWILAELSFEQPNGTIYTYQAELIQDPEQTCYLKGSCSAMKESKFVKYVIAQLYLRSVKTACLSA